MFELYIPGKKEKERNVISSDNSKYLFAYELLKLKFANQKHCESHKNVNKDFRFFIFQIIFLALRQCLLNTIVIENHIFPIKCKNNIPCGL